MNTPHASVSTETLHALLAQREWIERLARGLTRDAAQADDVAQESWIALMQRPPEHTGNLRSWLATLVRNTARKLARAESRRERRERAVVRDDATPAPAQAVERAEVARELLDALLALDEPYRAVLIRAYVDGLALHEIAHETGVPAATVRSQHARGLELLRERLDRGRDGDRARWFASVAGLALPRADVLGPGGVVGVLAMKWKLAAAAALVALLGFWIVSSRGDDLAQVREARAPAPAALESDGESLASATPFEREPVIASAPAALTAATTAALDIAVTWERDGTPAAHMHVLVLTTDGFGRRDDREATTDAAGRAHVDRLAPGKWGVYAAHGGSASTTLVAGTCGQLEVRIPRGVDVHGVVTQLDGTPVAGAAIELAQNAQADPGRLVASSGADGRFELRDVRIFSHLGARKVSFAPSRELQLYGEVGATLDVTLVLAGAGGSVSGSVRDASGAPIENARVIMMSEEPRPAADRKPTYGMSLESRTASAGTFRADGITPGRQRVVARAAGHVASEVQVDVRAGEMTAVELVLSAGGSLRGRVRIDGEVAAGVQLNVDLPGSAAYARVKTDSIGEYFLPDLPPGEHRVRVRDVRCGLADASVVLVAGECTQLDFALDAGRIVSGRVVDAQDRPLAGMRVELTCPDRNHAPEDGEDEFVYLTTALPQAKTDADGRFSLGHLPAMPLRLAVRPAKFTAGDPLAVIEDVVPPATDLIVRIDTDHTADAWICGRLVDSDGVPAGDVRIGASTKPDGSWDARDTNTRSEVGTGRFRLGPFRGDTYSLASGSTGWLVSTRFGAHELAAAQVLELGDLQIPVGGIVRVKVSRAGGAALGTPDFYLRSVSDSAREPSSFTWQFDRGVSRSVPAGEYELVRATSGGWAALGEPHITVRAREETAIEVVLGATDR